MGEWSVPVCDQSEAKVHLAWGKVQMTRGKIIENRRHYAGRQLWNQSLREK